MNKLIAGAIKKFDKINKESARSIIVQAAGDILLFEQVIDSINSGIIVCDKKYKTLLINSNAQRLLPLDILNYEEGESVLWEIIKDSDIAVFVEKTLIQGECASDIEYYVETKNGKRLLSISVLPLVHKKSVTGSLVIAEDITEKRQREIKLHQAENLASLTNVAGGVAHEIKNPLASLSIHIQLIQRLLSNAKDDFNTKELLPYQKLDKHLATVTEEIERLNKIVVDFLFAVRPMELEMIKSGINEIIKDTIEFLRYELEDANIKYKLNLQKKLPLVPLDKKLMRQVFINLIKNSIEALTSGGLLNIKTELNESEIKISIADNGPGISKENKAKIFEPYWTTKIKGTGLGLTLVYKIIHEHRGEINLISECGKGTCFVITLPLPQTEKLLLEENLN